MKKKFDLKICKKLQWCQFNKRLEQSKQIKMDQRPKHVNELETHTIKKNSNCNMNQKEEKGNQSCNHCGLYNFKNQKAWF